MGSHYILPKIFVKETMLNCLSRLPALQSQPTARKEHPNTRQLATVSLRRRPFSKGQSDNSFRSRNSTIRTKINILFILYSLFIPLSVAFANRRISRALFVFFFLLLCVWAAVRCATCPPPDAASSCRCTRRSRAHPPSVLFARPFVQPSTPLAAAAMSAAAPAAPAAGSTYAFNADIAQLMSLIINTFYSVRTRTNSRTRQQQQQQATN